MSGCAKAAIIGGVIVVVLGALVAIAIFVFFRRVADNVEDAIGENPCEYISSEEASNIIGSQVDAWSGDSFMGGVMGLIRDTRLLSDSPTCFLTGSDSSVQVWISVYDGSDAADIFAAWAAVADGQIVSQDTTESGTLTVETDAFRGEDVPGLGEEAFCVDVGAVVTGGVFARSDDRVVYVTALATQGEDVFSGDLCQATVPIAAALLG
jgi:hypothetical protein